MGLTLPQRLDLDRLCKEYNIVFIDELPPNIRPVELGPVFNAIDDIKRITFMSYRNTGNGQSPLGAALRHAELKARTYNLVEAARDCVARIEETWRLDCEPLALQRLRSDATCVGCRQSVRRSEIEEILASTGFIDERLQRLQGEGDRCSCPPFTRAIDVRAGPQRIFIGRASEQVIHAPSVAERLPRKSRPDRVYGLRQTPDLTQAFLGNPHMQSLFASTAHSPIGKPLLFPFLVVEAKGSKASDDWQSICLQTAFPIYTFLSLQQSLKAAVRQPARLTSTPLVWFIMSRGEDWRVYLAYNTPTCGGSLPADATHVVRVWTGSITNLDSALQLLLIVEYLTDWARDVYRAAVLADVESLAAPGIKPEPRESTMSPEPA
ncbi:hypothetical protein BJX68DRAFT_270296 [Aspergillus pseudodeflectus]|uniref:Uncharacterized protein n=1 Tax=Aspergillus pseudodeflectus TaxID=176178 RepID=A0ABR4JU32_9EURO